MARHKSSIALACCAVGVSETCYRFGATLRAANDDITDLLVGLTDARKTSGFGLCCQHLCNIKGRGWHHIA